MLTTTTVGAYPKPESVAVETWFGKRARRPSQGYEAALAKMGADAAKLLDQAVAEVVREQVAAGIDIPTDGEVRRDNYIHYHCRHLTGIDFERQTEKTVRAGAWNTTLPTITGPIAPRAHFLARDWRIAQGATERPVKITVPGPLSIADTLADDHYGDTVTLGRALAGALNFEVVALAEAGCRHIQIDEPVFARYPREALGFGVDHLERCFHGLPAAVTRTVHVCCGYPEHLDQEDYVKAAPETYFDLAAALDDAAIDAVSIEDAHRPNDLALLERFPKTTVILGVVAIAVSRIEAVEAIAGRLRQALEHIEPARLWAAPDCGLAMLPRELARAKLANLCAAAQAVG
ncbi:MAG: cobalamin-independent methionine synthase II family protein [Kiloniellales bacterium]